MAYPGPYGNTTIPTQAGGGGHWYDFLTKLLSGLKNAGTAVPAGAGAALSSVGDKLQLPEVLKILGSIGKGTGQVATSIGRQLPYAGPLVQAGEYGILNAVGKQDSPWAQGNAFIQRDTVQKQKNALAELMQQLQQQNITKGEQDIEKQLYEKGRRPFEEQKDDLGLLGDIQQYEKGGFDLQYSQAKLQQIQKEMRNLEEAEKIMGPTERTQLEKQKLQLDLDRIEADIFESKQRGVMYGKQGDWQERRPATPTGGTAQENLRLKIDDLAGKRAAEELGVPPAVYKQLGVPADKRSEFVRLKAKHKITLQEVIGAIMPEPSDTTMPGGGAVPPEATANVPPPTGQGVAEQQLADFESELAENPGMLPEMVFNLHRNEFDLANPEDLRAMKLIKDKYGIK